MNKFCTDAGYMSLNKTGEQLCGDHVEVVHSLNSGHDQNYTIAVLADGLGSGVKANILSTLTAKIISTMMANFLTVEDCVATIAETLPVCKVRHVAYSTFTIMRVTGNFNAEIIQYDNPPAIVLRDGKNFPYSTAAETIGEKTIYKTRFKLRENDVLIALSDGAVHAGTGKTMNLGWQRDDIIAYMEKNYEQEFTAKTLSSILVNKCYSLYGGEPGDDTTVCALKIRRRAPINLLIGPPADPRDVHNMMTLFFAKEGKHIVCGGTTSALAACFLGKPLENGIPLCPDPGVPPAAKIEGVDAVTEGLITIHKVLEYARDYAGENGNYAHWKYGGDGASLVARLLFEEATDINFYVGKAVNPAHQNSYPSLGINLKTRLVDELALCLKAAGKQVKVSYF
ncbi:MAG: serine/threonine-protein phosphatase [Treponema sp.]|jgi:hypothetical protein|nr:serine/threonine-protein phosphatase [Treponema sp.]